VIADLIRQYDFPFIALNPGASYRGLHDSLVNHNNDDPPMLICQHEKIAVQIAHGYAKATGRPMLAIVHNVVGLLQSLMGVYMAYLDRAPVFVIGATGPIDEAKRRPRIDWTHTAHAQGEALRNFVKWDYQPGGIDGVPNSFARAYSIMMSEPQGPVYMCYDAGLQEAPLEAPVVMPNPAAAKTPSRIAADPVALREAADRILKADWPVLLPEYVGRVDTGMADLVALAETLGAPVDDSGIRLNFPPQHPLDVRLSPEIYRSADLIVGLDLRDWEKPTHRIDPLLRTKTPYYPNGCEWLDIGFADIEINKWSMALCRAQIAKDPALATRIEKRRAAVTAIHDRNRAKWRDDARRDWDASPITLPRLASEVWDVIKDEDWVLTTESFANWAFKLWDFDRHYRHPGISLGTGTQIGIALGVALAHKGTGRVVVDCQPDGDLMFDAGALWTAARYEIPILIVMHNNRAYYNDWEHQIAVARQRGTPEERAYIGMDLVDPAPDFATLARSLGWYAEGPIEQPRDVAGALRRALEVVKSGKPALIDTITQRKG
jgi:acetolactate synthase-1/2/3 large subunit